jgi:hypothetical protein
LEEQILGIEGEDKGFAAGGGGMEAEIEATIILSGANPSAEFSGSAVGG